MLFIKAELRERTTTQHPSIHPYLSIHIKIALAVEATHVCWCLSLSAGIVDHCEKGHKQFVDKFGVQGAAQRKKA